MLIKNICCGKYVKNSHGYYEMDKAFLNFEKYGYIVSLWNNDVIFR